MTNTRKISQTDETAIRQGVRVMLERREVAWQRFVASVARCGGKGVDAALVAEFYLREKCARYTGAEYSVTHGGLLDRDVLLRANAMAAEKAAKRAAKASRR